MGKISGEVRELIEQSPPKTMVEIVIKLTPHGHPVGSTEARARRVFEFVWAPIAQRVIGFGGRIAATSWGLQTARCFVPAGCIFELSGVMDVCSIDLPPSVLDGD